jgi:hypothetical protein
MEEIGNSGVSGSAGTGKGILASPATQEIASS